MHDEHCGTDCRQLQQTLDGFLATANLQELGTGAFGRVVSRRHKETGQVQAVKQLLLNTFPSACGKKKRAPKLRLAGELKGTAHCLQDQQPPSSPQVSPRLYIVCRTPQHESVLQSAPYMSSVHKHMQLVKPIAVIFADVHMTNPRSAAKEFILAHHVAATAPQHVATPCGSWIEELVGGAVTAVILNLPMPEGRDLNKIKQALIGTSAESEVRHCCNYSRMPATTQSIV